MKRKLFGTDLDEKKKRRKNASEVPKHYPLSERQQMALLKQMTSAENSPDRSSPPPGSRKAPGSSRKDKINKRNERGETTLHLHTIRGDMQEIVHLIQMGADVNAQDFAGWTPLHEACNHGYEDIAQYLLEAGANVNSRGLEDDTPLHDAVTNANYTVVELLLKHGANPLLANSHGQRPLDVAEDNGIKQLLESQVIVSDESDVASPTEIPKPPDHDDVKVKISSERKSLMNFLTSDSESETNSDIPIKSNSKQKHAEYKNTSKTPALSAKPSKKIKSKQRRFSISSSSESEDEIISNLKQEKTLLKPPSHFSPAKYRPNFKSETSDDDNDSAKSKKSRLCVFRKEPRKISGSSTCSTDTFYSSEYKTESVNTKSNPDESVYDFSPSAEDFSNDVDEIHLKQNKNKPAPARDVKTLWESFSAEYKDTNLFVGLTNSNSDDAKPIEKSIKERPAKIDIELHELLTKPSKFLEFHGGKERLKTSLSASDFAESNKNINPGSVKKELKHSLSTVDTPSQKQTPIKPSTPTKEGIKIKKKKQKHKSLERSLSGSSKTETHKKEKKKEKNEEAGKEKSVLKKSESKNKLSKKEKKALLAKDHSLFNDLDKASKQKEREKREKQRIKRKKLSQQQNSRKLSSVKSVKESSESKAKKISEVKLLDDDDWLGMGSHEKKPLVKKQKSLVRELPKTPSTPTATTTVLQPKQTIQISLNMSEAPPPITIAQSSAWLFPPPSLVTTPPPMTGTVFSYPMAAPPTPNPALYHPNQDYPGTQEALNLNVPYIPLNLTPAPAIPHVITNSPTFVENIAPPAQKATTEERVPDPVIQPVVEDKTISEAAIPQAEEEKVESVIAPEIIPEVEVEEEEVNEYIEHPFVPLNEKELKEKEEKGKEDTTRTQHIKEYIRKHIEKLEVIIDDAAPVVMATKPVKRKTKMRNVYEEWAAIQREVLEKRRKIAAPVIPQAPQCYWEYMSLTGGYLLNDSRQSWLSIPSLTEPLCISEEMRGLFIDHENERSRLRLQHAIQREKLIVSCEQEIMRVHSRAARTLQNQQVPLSACSVLLDREVYCTEQHRKNRKAEAEPIPRTSSVRDRFNARMFISWLQDVDDKFDKMKDTLLARQRHEASALHAVQRTEWALKLSDRGQQHWTSPHDISNVEVPLVNISDDFELLPA